MTDEDWANVIAVIQSGAFFMAQAAVEHMIERGSGSVVFVNSIIVRRPAPPQGGYAVSKGGLFTAARVLANCRPDGMPLPEEIKLFAPVLRDAGLLG